MDKAQQPRSRRQEILEMAANLQQVKDSSPEVQAVLRLVGLLFEEARDGLLRASPETFPPLTPGPGKITSPPARVHEKVASGYFLTACDLQNRPYVKVRPAPSAGFDQSFCHLGPK